MNFSMNFKKYIMILSIMSFVVASGAPYVYASIEGTVAVSGQNDKGVYDENGFDKDGFDKDGFDKDGYGKDSFNKNGVNCRGFKRDGINVDTGTAYNKYGYDINGFDRDGNFMMSSHYRYSHSESPFDPF